MHLSLQKEINYTTLIKLWVSFLLMVPGALRAQFTSTITGFFPKSWEGKQAMVVAKPLSGPNVIDTTTIVNRSATFTIKLDEPSPAYLWVEGNPDDIQFFIDSPLIKIGVDPEALPKPLITGSASSELWVEQFEDIHDVSEFTLGVQSDMHTALFAGDSLTAFNLEHVLDSLRTVDKNKLAKFIQDYPSLAASWVLFASNTFPYSQTIALFEKLSSFDSFPSYQRIKEKLARKQLGTKAPDFNLPNAKGRNLTLSALANRYILIDFSMRHLVACQKRHSDLKKLYKQYQSRGFEIITVSFEFDKDYGLEALRKYALPWIQVQDIMDTPTVMKEFAVEQMPDNILLDANKIMIGRDMSVSELDEKLQQLLKK